MHKSIFRINYKHRLADLALCPYRRCVQSLPPNCPNRSLAYI